MMVDIANFEYPLFNCWARHCIAAVPERERERPRQGRLRVVGIRCGLTPTCAGAGRERQRHPRQQQFGTTATARRHTPLFQIIGVAARVLPHWVTRRVQRLNRLRATAGARCPAACWVAAPARHGS